MAKATAGNVVASTAVKATKTPVKPGIAAGDDCGCVGDQGCCKDKGCCRQGKCPAESLGTEMGCGGDDFALRLQDREDLVTNYLIANKASVVAYFQAKGVAIKQ